MSFVKSQQEGAVLTLTLDRPEALNALNAQVLNDLSTALDGVDLSTVRCIILTGSGEKAFAAGADIAAMADMGPEASAAFSRHGNEVFRRIETFPCPTIAAVNGYALGGGCELSMACDIRLCSENALFGQPEVTLGITPGFGGTQRLMRLIGMGRAKELIFTCDTLNAEDAYRMGLANHVVPQEELMDFCLKMAEKITSKASYAVSLAKASINNSMNVDVISGGNREMDLRGLAFATNDKKEGMEAFLARRKPDFHDF